MRFGFASGFIPNSRRESLVGVTAIFLAILNKSGRLPSHADKPDDTMSSWCSVKLIREDLTRVLKAKFWRWNTEDRNYKSILASNYNGQITDRTNSGQLDRTIQIFFRDQSGIGKSQFERERERLRDEEFLSRWWRRRESNRGPHWSIISSKIDWKAVLIARYFWPL